MGALEEPERTGDLKWRLGARAFGTLAGLFLFLLAGCRAAPDRFTVGLFGAPPASVLPELSRTGFQVVVAPPSPDYLAAAAAADLGVLAVVPAGPEPGADPSRLRRATREQCAYDRHSALWAWYLADEPELHRVPPAELERSRAALRRTGARKPSAVVCYNGYLARDYVHAADTLLLDRYPIPRLPLADFAKHLQLARLAAGSGRPFHAVLQAFDWTAFEPSHSATSRPPSRAELRAMTYLALVHGARGVFYFTYHADRWHLPDHPQTWSAVRDLAREIRLFEPLFAGRHRWLPYTTRFPNPADARNEALDPSVQTALLEVRDGNDYLSPGPCLVAVNTLGRPVPWQFRPPPGWPSEIVTLHELRELRARDGWFADVLPPFGVRVYHPRVAEARD